MIIEIKLLTDDGSVILAQTQQISAHMTHKLRTDLLAPIVDGDAMLTGMETTFDWHDMRKIAA